MKYNSEEKKRVSQKCRQIRGHRSMDQMALAIGVSKSSVSGYEKGLFFPKPQVIKRYIEFSKSLLSIEEFIYGTFEEQKVFLKERIPSASEEKIEQIVSEYAPNISDIQYYSNDLFLLTHSLQYQDKLLPLLKNNIKTEKELENFIDLLGFIFDYRSK